MQDKKVSPNNKLYWDKPQVVHLKWIFMRDYIPHRLCQCRHEREEEPPVQCHPHCHREGEDIKKAKEHMAMGRRSTGGKLSSSVPSSQNNHRRGNYHPSPPLGDKKRRCSSYHGHGVDDAEDEGAGGSWGGWGGCGGGGSGGGK